MNSYKAQLSDLNKAKDQETYPILWVEVLTSFAEMVNDETKGDLHKLVVLALRTKEPGRELFMSGIVDTVRTVRIGHCRYRERDFLNQKRPIGG